MHSVGGRGAVCAASLAVSVALLTGVPSTPAFAKPTNVPCVDGTQRENLTARWASGYTALTVTPRGQLCAAVMLVASSYIVPSAWNRDGFNRTAVPQQLFDSVEFTVSGSVPVTVALSVPQCGNAQVDLYYPPVVREVDIRGHVRLINGVIFRVGDCPVLPGPPPDLQPIVVTIPAGSLVISTPYTPSSPLRLDDMALSPDSTLFSSAGRFEGIVIADTRTGSLGWTAGAASGDPTNSDGGRLDAQNVGLTDLVVDPIPGNALPGPPGNVTLFDNPPASPVAAVGEPGSQGLGGGVAHQIASARQGRGSLRLAGVLLIRAPTSAPAGTYVATITFTVV